MTRLLMWRRSLNLDCYTTDISKGFDFVDGEINGLHDYLFYHPAYWDVIKYLGAMYGDAPIKK